jgi:soluble lytic murein transglycosylase-like protein
VIEPGTVRVLRLGLWLTIVLLAWGLVANEVWGQIPADASKYKRDLIRNSRLVWGLDAPVSTFAGQIHQESGWHPDAVSPVGASGLAQFMPSTATWISGTYDTRGDNQPTNPAWAIRALVQYDKWLYDRVPPARSHCERMAFVLSSYNGGLGWLQRDVNLARTKGADPQSWFDYVEKFNGGRSDAAFRENRGYPRRILLELERRYVNDGWGIKSC